VRSPQAIRDLKLLLVACTLASLFPSYPAAGPPADTAQRLAGRVLLYSVFVHDAGDVQWEADKVLATEQMARQAADQLQGWASQYGVPLTIETGSTHVWTVFDIRNPPPNLESWKWEQGWIRDAFRSTGALHEGDDDQFASDDLILWLQRVHGPAPISVVVVFQFPFDADPSTSDEAAQQEGGPFIRMYPDGPHCSVSGYDWRAYAHEFLHAFGACDEYGCRCQCENGYLAPSYQDRSPGGETNYNCEVCGGQAALPCLMKSCALEPTLCLLTRRQIGWGDWNNNGSPDAIDFTDGLETRSLTSTDAFRLWGPAGQFLVADAAGGELKMAPRAESLGVYAFADTMPFPASNQTRLLAIPGQLLAIVAGKDSIYSCGYQNGDILGGWQFAGIGALSGSLQAAVSGNFLYAKGWGISLIRFARIDRSDGTISSWTGIANPPMPNPSNDDVSAIAVSGGFLYAAIWHWLGLYQGNQIFVVGAPLTPSGGIGAWGTLHLVTETPYPVREDIHDLVGDEGGLFLASIAYDGISLAESRIRSTRLTPDGDPVTWTEGPNLPVLRGGVRLIAATGKLFAVGGEYYGPRKEVWMTTIAGDKTTEAWTPLRDLPFATGASHLGVCATSDGDSSFLWVGGGYSGSGDHNDLYSAPLLSGTEYSPEARVSLRVPLSGGKLLKSIALRSTKPDNTALRYRFAATGTASFGSWLGPAPETNGRIVFPGDGESVTDLELQLIVTGDTRVHDITLVYTDPNPGSTPVGYDVLTTLPSSAGQCRFESVAQAGMTTADATQTPPAAPPGFAARSAFDVGTSATFDGPFEIGVRYDPLTVGSEAKLRLFHWNGTAWDDLTTSVDPIGRMVRGQTVGFSTFAVMEDTSRSDLVGVALPGTSHPLIGLDVEANAPNPFAQNTRIRFSLSSPSRTTLRVYDASGRVVRTLLDELRPGGRNEVTWDGIDGDGARVPSGVYFFQLQAGARSETKKAVLVR